MPEQIKTSQPSESIDLLQQSQQFQNEGNLLEAAQCLQTLLEREPQNIEALLLLSLVGRQSQQFTLSLQLAQEVVRLKPDDPRNLFNLAQCYRSVGAQQEAAACCEEALKLDSLFVAAHCVLGEVLYAQGKKDEARHHLQESIRKNPNYEHGYCCLGNLEAQEGDFHEAAKCYAQAVQVAPDWAEGYFALGYALHELRDRDRAIGALKCALQLRPFFPEALLNLGNLFYDYKEMEQAAKVFRILVRMNPTNAKAFCSLGNALTEMNRFDEAAECYQASLALDPDSTFTTHKFGNLLCFQRDWSAAEKCFRKVLEKDTQNAEAYNDFGNIFFHQRKLSEAAERYRKALEIKPNLAIAHSNLGNVLQDQGDFLGAIVHYEKSVELDPTSPGAHYNLALTQLCEGDYRQGWKGYEWRWDFNALMSPRRPFTQPMWQGELLYGKRILLHAEQGLGDTLQFIRYIPMVAARGGRVILEVAPTLVKLLANFPGVQEIVGRGNPLPHFDYQCPLMSLPLAFDTTIDTIPGEFPYIEVSQAEAAQAKIACPGEGFRVGITWSGNPKNKRDDLRSLSLKELLPLANIPGVSFFALQQGPAITQIAELCSVFPINNTCSSFGNFRETAALVETLDLVISVDTAVAHLAGAMNKPVWLLLPFIPDWRWMRNREDSPWYPTARLFRQTESGDWAGVVAQVTEALSVLAEENKQRMPSHMAGACSWPAKSSSVTLATL